MQQSGGKLEGQAQQALAAGREDLAREALSRRTAVASQVTDLQTQQASLQAEEEKLTLAAAPRTRPNSSRLRRWRTSPLPDTRPASVRPRVESATDRSPVGGTTAAAHHHLAPHDHAHEHRADGSAITDPLG